MNGASDIVLGQALAHHKAGRLAEAEQIYRSLLAARPADATLHHFLAFLLNQTGRVDEAVAHYRLAASANPRRIETHLNLAGILLGQGSLEEAMASFRAALKLDANHLQTLQTYAAALARMERHVEAEALYREALRAVPGNAALHVNLGMALAAQDRLEEAVACHQAALRIAPADATAFFQMANAYTQQERFDEAIAAYRRALEIRPDIPRGRANLGVAICRAGRLEESMTLFSSLLEKRTDTGDSPPHKARHDLEQRDYLKTALWPADGARVTGPAVNPANGAAVAARWQDSDPKIVTIDDLLTPAALENLRRYCLAAPVWTEPYENGYLGAMPVSGFGAPVIAQIAEELRAVFPSIFLDHPLYYFWGYKYDSRLTGINIHGDDAAVNVNFWITPDGANRDPQSGGLVVWDVVAPHDWSFAKFNGDHQAIRDFLKREGARPVTVPHRTNRAVIFQSDLFHETDRIVFEEGYLNRRINVTMLFGKRAR